ncbi:FxsA family protein [Mobilicoccus sp.]|uniref:FxsA family protein n=1 Tax=Mobilicoccus sp. TaxID=2034349 RepID=UPI00289B673B|nr:FxsA family protein [Mobilicoccus sp.]
MSAVFPPSSPGVGPAGPGATGRRTPRRGRPRLMLFVALAVLLPVLEIAALVATGRAIGVLPTILVLLAVSVLGLWLIKREGLSSWRSLRQAGREGRVPTQEVANAAVVLGAGALFLLPGFLTDVLAVILLLPVVRPAVARFLQRSVEQRVAARVGIVRSVRVDSVPPRTQETGPLELGHLDLRPRAERD